MSNMGVEMMKAMDVQIACLWVQCTLHDSKCLSEGMRKAGRFRMLILRAFKFLAFCNVANKEAYISIVPEEVLKGLWPNYRKKFSG